MSNKQAHLGMIQGVINRLSQNSFLLKGWSIALISALFALAAKDAEKAFIYVAYFPAACFWLLDAYFLHQERLFRRLYDHARRLQEEEIDFAMNAAAHQTETDTYGKTAFSKTLVGFHAVIVVAILLAMAASVFLSQ